jgi:hypothetical protein
MAEIDSSKYTAPRAVRLSDSPVGQGALCVTYGSNATADCTSGNTAQACVQGNTAAAQCQGQGLTAQGCASGHSPSHVCNTGSTVQHL